MRIAAVICYVLAIALGLTMPYFAPPAAEAVGVWGMLFSANAFGGFASIAAVVTLLLAVLGILSVCIAKRGIGVNACLLMAAVLVMHVIAFFSAGVIGWCAFLMPLFFVWASVLLVWYQRTHRRRGRPSRL